MQGYVIEKTGGWIGCRVYALGTAMILVRRSNVLISPQSSGHEALELE